MHANPVRGSSLAACFKGVSLRKVLTLFQAAVLWYNGCYDTALRFQPCLVSFSSKLVSVGSSLLHFIFDFLHLTLCNKSVEAIMKKYFLTGFIILTKIAQLEPNNYFKYFPAFQKNTTILHILYGAPTKHWFTRAICSWATCDLWRVIMSQTLTALWAVATRFSFIQMDPQFNNMTCYKIVIRW